jgi:hypothetical protein
MKPQSLCHTSVMHISVKNPQFGVGKTNSSWEPNRQVKFRILLAPMSHQQIVEFENIIPYLKSHLFFCGLGLGLITLIALVNQI